MEYKGSELIFFFFKREKIFSTQKVKEDNSHRLTAPSKPTSESYTAVINCHEYLLTRMKVAR